MGKIAFFDVEGWEKPLLKKKLSKHELMFFKDSLNEKNAGLCKDCEVVGVFIYSKVSAKTIAKLPKLRLVATLSTGFDHVDLSACKKRGVTVCNVPSYGENTVAEHTFALILNLSRKVHQAYERTVRGNFSLEGLRGFDLKGKTIGVVGVGKIGQHVVRIARGFEMNVVAFDPFASKELENEFGFKLVSLDYLLKNSDIVSLHCPANKSTNHLLGMKEFGLMKKDALVINTARGSIIDTDALVNALSSGKIAGAGLDVLEEESGIKEERELLSSNIPVEKQKLLLQQHILLTFSNVIVTPHNAFNSNEALERILETTVENIDGYFNKRLVNIVHTHK